MKTYLQEVGAIAFRILIELVRTRRSLQMWIIFPTLMLLLLGLIYSGRNDLSVSFDRTAPGVLIGAAFFFSCLGGPIALIVGERERHTLRRLLLSPIKPASYFSGIVLAYLAIAAMQTFIVYGISFLFGGKFHGSIVYGLVIICLSVFSFVGLGFFFGARFTKRTEDVIGPVAAFGVPLLILGCTFFPVHLLPPYLLIAAQFDPILHMNESLKAVSAHGATFHDIQEHLFFLVCFAVLSLFLGIWSYKKMLSLEKRG